MDIKELRRLIDLFEKSGISELEIDEKGTKVRLRKGNGGHGETPPQRHAPISPPPPSPAVQHKLEEVTAGIKHKKIIPKGDNYIIVDSPMVGTFYSAPSEGAEPYVKEGDIVERGQTLCIVEAMKLMNEIESEVGGRVVSILIDNAHPVEFGEPMFVIEKI